MDTFEREQRNELRETSALSTAGQSGYESSGTNYKNARDMQQAIEERDRRIQILEKQLVEYGVRIPNYPPCYPFLHLDIDNEVPARRRFFGKCVLYAYYYTCTLLIINLICMFTASQSADKPEVEVNHDQWEESQWLSIAFLLGIPVAFPLWFWTTYTALTTGKQSRYVYSVIGLCLGWAGSVFGIIGLIGYGTVGIFSMFRGKRDKGDAVFFFMLVVLVLWCIKCAFMTFAIIRQVKYMRDDKKIQKIGEQAASMIVRAAIDRA